MTIRAGPAVAVTSSASIHPRPLVRRSWSYVRLFARGFGKGSGNAVGCKWPWGEAPDISGPWFHLGPNLRLIGVTAVTRDYLNDPTLSDAFVRVALVQCFRCMGAPD